MLACLSETHKASWFRRVVFKNGRVPEYRLVELAEDAFLIAWEDFSKRGRAGNLHLSGREYTGFFFIAFKNNYLKLLEKELRQKMAEQAFGERQDGTGDAFGGGGLDADRESGALSPRTQQALKRIGENCRELLIWRHVEQLSHDEIARRRKMDRKSSIKMVSRCGKKFAGLWRENLG